MLLSYWGRVTHICVSKLTITGSNNGLSPGRRRAIIWTDAGILLIRPRVTNSEILIEIHTFSLDNIRLKMSSAKCCPFCLGLNVFIHIVVIIIVFLCLLCLIQWKYWLACTVFFARLLRYYNIKIPFCQYMMSHHKWQWQQSIMSSWCESV